MTLDQLPPSAVPVLPPRVLLGPGPSNANPRVLQAMGGSMIGYLDADFMKVLDEVSELLRLLFQTEDGLTIEGAPAPPGGARITTDLDHRIAMAFLVMGVATRHPVEIDDGRTIATSFPGFTELLNGLGARITAAS